jgi:2-polyprenyl-3-methyl-5-hydroxy-6-metoxy-1,4-benzoquinol methylase
LKIKEYNITGLELNKSAIETIYKETGHNILNETIQQHSFKNKGSYDIVCSFQVMEHIADIKNVIEASILCLKKGGKLIISVPNNESNLYRYKTHPLNEPPHHVGLWDSKSLKNLELFFNIKLVNLFYEPIETWEHKKIYIKTHSKMLSEGFKLPWKLFVPLYILKSFFISKNYKGLTVQAHYLKL